jgi:hypothetical protein
MSDDLVNRLRDKTVRSDEGNHWNDPLCLEAANRIEQLEAELHHCFHRIEELQAALLDLCDGWECCAVSRSMRAVARKALDGKDE